MTNSDDEMMHTEPFQLQATEGEFKGWQKSGVDAFEANAGPFYHRAEADGKVRCAFRVEKKHLNGAGNVHGGCFMSFADYCLFAIAESILDGPVVTVTFSGEFLDTAREGELIEGAGEVTRAGRSLVFVRGELKSGERRVFTYSGTLKRRRRSNPSNEFRFRENRKSVLRRTS